MNYSQTQAPVTPYDRYKAVWSSKSTFKVQRELDSWRFYMDRNSSAYSWHGKGMTPPGSLSDGDKVTALKEILTERIGRGFDEPKEQPK